MAEDDVNPIQMDQMEILDTNARMFKSWGSVEVRDRENDLLPMNEFRKIMPVIMKRGGILMDRHSNRQVGKILNFEFKEKETPEGIREGVMITGEIFKDYEHDDMVWQGIKDGVYKGLSFGGRNKIKDVRFDKSGLTNILQKLEGFEFSLVPAMGNQESTMEEVNFLAKSGVKNATELSKEYIQKPFAGFSDFDDCVKQNQDKRDPAAFCAFLKDRVEKIEKQYYEDEYKKKSLTEKNLSLLQSNDKSEKYIKEKDLNKSMEADEIKKFGEMTEKNSSDIVKINKTLSEISESLKVLKQEKEEEEEEKEKKKIAHEEDEEKEKKKAEHKDDEDKEKKKQNNDEDKDKKPEEELEKANGAEGERKVKLPEVPAEETGEGEPAQGAEDDKVDFVEKSEFEVVKKQLADLTNKAAQTPRPATGLINKLEEDAPKPKNQKDIAKLIMKMRTPQ